MNKKEEPNTTGLNKAFHEPARLAIMGSLVTVNELTFSELMETHNFTRGNLSMHMKLLCDLGYVSVHKSFVKNRPRTAYQLTGKGKSEFISYIDSLEMMIKNIRGNAS